MGARLLGDATSDYLVMGAEVALCHHENWDGSGYPQGLSGEAIPLPARIMAVCDRYDALRAKRPYKRAYRHDEAMEVMLKGDERSLPGHIDPELLSVFKRHALRFDEVFHIHQTI
jgi:putative two-component system response regulator